MINNKSRGRIKQKVKNHKKCEIKNKRFFIYFLKKNIFREFDLSGIQELGVS